MAKVLVVEDCRAQAAAARLKLERAGHQVEVAGNGRDCLERARGYAEGLILLDLGLPDMRGESVLRELRRGGYGGYVAAFTGHADEETRIRLFHLGADQFLDKLIGPEEFLARVESLARRAESGSIRGAGSETTESFGSIAVDVRARSVHRGGRAVKLRPKEFDLLLALLHRRGTVASRLELLAEVWGHRGAVLTRTVDSHVAALRRKLEDAPAEPQHLLTVSTAGYRLRREVDRG